MKEFEVTIPIVGMAYLTIQAETEADAIAEAMKIASPEDVNEWQAHEHIVRGNVCYVQPSSAVAKYLSDLDEA